MDEYEIAEVYSRAVPFRIVADKINSNNPNAIYLEREAFRKFILDTFAEGLMFYSQRVAWEAYNWDFDRWMDLSDFALEFEGVEEPLFWEDDLYAALKSRVRPSNYGEHKAQM